MAHYIWASSCASMITILFRDFCHVTTHGAHLKTLPLANKVRKKKKKEREKKNGPNKKIIL